MLSMDAAGAMVNQGNAAPERVECTAKEEYGSGSADSKSRDGSGEKKHK
jgi:hypothetical protein